MSSETSPLTQLAPVVGVTSKFPSWGQRFSFWLLFGSNKHGTLEYLGSYHRLPQFKKIERKLELEGESNSCFHQDKMIL